MMTLEERARTVLRSYLISCHKAISAGNPEFANIPAENAADYLIHLKNTGKITITLDTLDSQIVCKIEDTDR